MKDLKVMISVSVFLVFFILFFSTPVYAYIDPGTGSYIIQLLLAGFLGALLAVKIFWKKLKIFFSNLFNKGKQE